MNKPNIVHLDARRHAPLVMSFERKAALEVVQRWLNQSPDGDAYLTAHSMDTRKFALVDLIAALKETGK